MLRKLFVVFGCFESSCCAYSFLCECEFSFLWDKCPFLWAKLMNHMIADVQFCLFCLIFCYGKTYIT